MTSSHLQQALARGTPVWGGWITGPTHIGPEEFARAGYDYVGFDAQHGYLDDADIANILRRLEHVPIGTAVRLPSVDPAPIGRVLDAGADAIIVADGTSCRHQIHDGAGREAMHVARVLAMSLDQT